MKADPVQVGRLLEARVRYCVPTYQRDYVWKTEKSVRPFWEDVLAKAGERLSGRSPRFSHYMGAVVVEVKTTYNARQVTPYMVVDGQQRLTTFQLFLAAIRDVAVAEGLPQVAEDLARYLVNDGRLEEPKVERYKVWPTGEADQRGESPRVMFTTIINGPRAEIRSRFKQHFYANRDQIYDYNNTPRMLAAYGFFFDEVRKTLTTGALADAASADGSGVKPDRAQQLEALWRALLEDFKVIEILLQDGDDAQIIFETLNERGERLLAFDLVKNNVYHRAEEAGASPDELFAEHWKDFQDNQFWNVEEKQGRYKKQRRELLLMNYLAAQTARDTTMETLFSEYKLFARSQTSWTVEREMKELASFAVVYRELVRRDRSTSLGRFAARLKPWDVTTVFPLVMKMALQDGLPPGDLDTMLNALMSFIVRRAVCGLTAKNYNKFFLTAITELNTNGWTARTLLDFLETQNTETGRWPRDDEFKQRWLAAPVYDPVLGSARTRAILEEIEVSKQSRFTEFAGLLKPDLTVEHVLPDTWYAHWGSASVPTPTEADIQSARLIRIEAEDGSPLGLLARRQRLKHSIGNLTLLTQPLNSTVQNSDFATKLGCYNNPQFGSLLLLTREVAAYPSWDEDAILARAGDLFTVASQLWHFGAPATATQATSSTP